jgi:GNAT superfamily N-acetyltransferase
MSVTIRPASPGDYMAYVRLFPELGVDDPTPTEETFRRMAPTTLFAVDDGAIAGCLVYQRTPPEGFVNQLIVSRDWRARGVGARLMLHAAKIMQAAGCETWALNVKQRNAPARKLYHGMGMCPAHETAVLRMAWGDITALQPLNPDEQICDVTGDKRFDERVETIFAMKPGWLEKLREGGAIVLKLATERDELTGFAGFRPGFPAVLAFNARDEGCAAGLLQAVMAHRRPLDTEPGCWRRDHVKIIIQRQPELIAVLRRRGAHMQYMLDLMRGPLPPPAHRARSSRNRIRRAVA